jgi:ParB-like chromosome segregation protein Spo0J
VRFLKIARPAGKRYEIAFGHHRLEAARRNKLEEYR